MDSFPKIKDWNKWEQDNKDNKLQLIEKKKLKIWLQERPVISSKAVFRRLCVWVVFIIFIDNAGKESKDVWGSDSNLTSLETLVATWNFAQPILLGGLFQERKGG